MNLNVIYSTIHPMILIVNRALPLSLALCAGLLFTVGAEATDLRRTSTGLAYLTGGVTPQELKAIATQRSQFSFSLVARSSLSGGPVADAQVRIIDASGKQVLDAAMDGPWLLVAIAPGRYQVTVTFQDETLRRDVDVPATGQRELAVSFRSATEVSLYPVAVPVR